MVDNIKQVSEFKKHLQVCYDKVQAWPEWKRNLAIGEHSSGCYGQRGPAPMEDFDAENEVE